MADNVTHGSHDVEHSHPTAKTYIVIAVILAIITAAEVAVFYVPALESVLAFLLLTMSAAKFILVVMFYMHLKSDSRIFSGVFLAPLSLALFMVVGIVLLFRVLPLL